MGYDDEREAYAKKLVKSATKDLQRELDVLKTEEKVRNQKLDDLQYDHDSLKEDLQYLPSLKIFSSKSWNTYFLFKNFTLSSE